MNKKSLFSFEITGIIVVFILATLLHFSYEWSNGETWAILFGSVNESIWEHVKIFAIPYIAYATLEVAILDPPFKRFVTAKVIGLYVLILSIIMLFYMYTCFTGTAILPVDITISVLALIVAFLTSYTLILNLKKPETLFTLSVFALMAFIVMCVGFTVSPPQIDLFRDPLTSRYGIPDTSLHESNTYYNARHV